MRSRHPIGTVLLLLATACGDSGDLTAPERAEIALLISDAVPATDSAGASAGTATYAYVSLPAGAIPRGRTATVRNRANGAEAQASIVGGAVDPVRLPAVTGDSLELTAVDSSGGEYGRLGEVKRNVPPVVVRSDPAKGVTDAPTLIRVAVVFSEPVSASSINTNTVVVTLRDEPVPGQVDVSSDGLVAQFVPDDSLVPGATYTLAVSRGVRDRSGDALAREYRAEFTVVRSTGPTIEFSAISAGSGYTCAVSTDGGVYCWGKGGKGQLGSGDLVDRHRPTRVVLPSRAVEVETGLQTTCALTDTRRVICWGNPYTLSRSSDSLYPLPAPVLGDREMLHAAVGGGRMCGVDQENVWCIGGRSDHDGILFTTEQPGPWLWLEPSLARGAQASLGVRHDCFVTADRAAYCEGENSNGQLGVGWARDTSAGPVPVVGGLSFSSITTGLYHTCGLAGEEAYCWGLNTEGALGSGAGYNTGTPTAVDGGLRFATLDGGAFHNCGTTLAGAAYCWGNNRNGQLGDGTRVSRATPVAVLGGVRFRSISAGADHTCALSVDGVVYCWGENESGQLGDGSTSDALTPVRVAYQR
jgi:hypothetical protein